MKALLTWIFIWPLCERRNVGRRVRFSQDTSNIRGLGSPCDSIYATTAPAVIESRIRALVNMLKVNMSIHTIRLHDYYSEHELFRGSVIPYLKTNWLRSRLLAIQKTRPMAYRAKVLGRALLAVRTDINGFWILLSGNPEVAFMSTAARTTPAAKLPGYACYCCRYFYRP
jgi:hypothetical protein